MRRLVTLALGLGLLAGCGSDDDDDGETTYDLPNASYECMAEDNENCNEENDGKEVRGVWFLGDCDDFGSSTDILSLATVDAACPDENSCAGKDQDTFLTDWSKAQLAAGDYSLYVFIDINGNEVPDGEPYACSAITIPRESGAPNLSDFQ